jgi:hypothetical protein
LKSRLNFSFIFIGETIIRNNTVDEASAAYVFTVKTNF